MDIMSWKWYRIPGFNGYEYNFENKVVRSIKNYKVNPYGKLIKKYEDSGGYFYKMSNMQNEVKKVYLNEIETMINKDPLKKALPTNCTNMGSRNIVTRKRYIHGDQSDKDKYESFMPDFSSMIIK